jgi:hypothetical protein
VSIFLHDTSQRRWLIKSEDLESQVAKLISEKTSLENENRLLKAIVLNGTGGQADALQGALTAFGKRKREA